MSGPRHAFANQIPDVPRDERWLVNRLHAFAWLGVTVCLGIFVVLDIGLVALVPEIVLRLGLRWLAIAGTGVMATVLLRRRTLDLLSRAVRGERAARREAEALAGLAATAAASQNIQGTLTTAVDASVGLLGQDVRCGVALAQTDLTWHYVVASGPAAETLMSLTFSPHDEPIGTAIRERRAVRIADASSGPDPCWDIGRQLSAHSLVLAPLIAEDRVLGVICADSPVIARFGKPEERLLSAVARHLAVALVAAQARDAARREAIEKAAIIDQMADAVLVADGDRRVVECNRAAARLFDERAEDLIGIHGGSVPWRMFTEHGELVSSDCGPLSRALGGEFITGEYRLRTRSGIERYVYATATPLRAPDGALSGGILVMRDIADWRRAESALRDSEERYRRLVELCPDPIVVSCAGEIVYANAATVALVGAASPTDLLGRDLLDFVARDVQQTFVERTRATVELDEGNRLSQTTLRRLDGELIQIESATMPISFNGRPAIQAVIRDVTERKRAEAALAHQAMHDALTGLPNRVLLLDRLEQAISASRRNGTELGLLLMDLDRFKEVNDTLGHHAGDLLLQQVGTRLRGVLGQGETIARLGGDEFALILPNTAAERVLSVADNLLRRLHAPFSVEGQPVVVGASIGVALAPQHGDEAAVLMRRADVAMYVAKRNSAGFAMYCAEQDRNSADRLSLIGELRRGIDEGELVVHYQPKINLRTGDMSGVEALVRWEHPLRGLLAPDQFIPVAEQAGLIDSLSRWVLRAALMQASAWRRVGLEIPIAVNLSMRSLHDEQLPVTISELLRDANLPSSLLAVEITESSLMVDPPRTMAILTRLREMGIRVAIDDFGTGHSSLAYLKRLPVDEVKLDRSFVYDIAVDDTDRAIVRSTVDLAHSLGLRVVAEGVGDEITGRILAEIGCDEAQGFHLGRPLRGRELTHWLWDRLPARAA